VTRISLRAVPFDNPRAQALLAAFYADQLTRYERADPPHEPASDYAPPHGLFLLLGVGDQPAGCGGTARAMPPPGKSSGCMSARNIAAGDTAGACSPSWRPRPRGGRPLGGRGDRSTQYRGDGLVRLRWLHSDPGVCALP
jgi:hypothetical protein